MGKRNSPKTYAQAHATLARLQEADGSSGRVLLSKGTGGASRCFEPLWLAPGRVPDTIAVVSGGVEVVTFHPDGRVKLCSQGCNTNFVTERINSCLPAPYRLAKRGCHLFLLDPRRGKHGAPVATFLSSTVFRPVPLFAATAQPVTEAA